MAKQLTGIVSSDKANKTIVITVRSRRTHPLYKKQYTVNTKFMAHDEQNQAKIGDLVSVIECKPLSARKRFTLEKIIERAGARFEETDATADVPEEQLAPEPATPPEAKKTEPKAVKAKTQEEPKEEKS